jgi:acylphosphatase
LKTRAHLFVSGRVQGVFFRSATKREAEIRGVKGVVRNLSDGRLEAVFEGEDEAVRALIEYCRHGPRSATVTGLDLTWEAFTGEFEGFSIE